MDPLPFQLSDASGVPYYRQIVDQVSELIRSGRLAQEARLPSVRELAGQLLVSLITIRRSYADLEGMGLIVRKQGYGTFVAPRVERATRQHAMEEARSLLAEIVARARRLGLNNDDLRKLVEELLDPHGAKDGNR